LKDADNRTISLTNELDRVAKIVREKEALVLDFSNKCREYASISEEKNMQLSNLRQESEKMMIAVNHAEESKGNFQLFLKEIDRLNQVVVSK
jgi:hypothetical protein